MPRYDVFLSHASADKPAVEHIAVIPDRRIIVAGDKSGGVHFFDFVEGGDRVDAGTAPGSTPG